MFTSLSISGYRGLRDLAIERLGRVNLLAGANGSGKTSVLEALFLLAHGGNAQPAINANVLRGPVGAELTPDAAAQALWGPFFSDLDLSRPVTISGRHSRLGSLRLKIEHHYATRFRVPPTSRDTGQPANGTHQLRFALTQKLPNGRRGQAVTSRVAIEREGTTVEVGGDPLIMKCVILSSTASSPADDVKRLGRMRRRKKAGLVVQTLRIVEPRLQQVEIIPGPGGLMLWGDIGLSEQVPLSALGDGLNRLAKLVLAMAHDMGAVVLVDEIENGFHHTILDKVWGAVFETAREFDTQLIATTHSYEAIVAAQSASRERDLTVYRLEQGADQTKCVSYDAESIGGAVEHGLEVR